jgi:hypothetical protein
MTKKGEDQPPHSPARQSAGERRDATAAENLAAAKAMVTDCQTLLAATKSYEKAIRLVQAGETGDPNVFLEDHLERISDGMGALLLYLDQVLTDLEEVRRRTLSLIDQIQDRA